MSDHTPTTTGPDTLWKRLAICATACVLFVVLASSLKPQGSQAKDTPAADSTRTTEFVPGVPPVDATPQTTIPAEAMGDVASADSGLIGTLEGVRYNVAIHATMPEPLYSVFDRHSKMEVASMLTGQEMRDAFPTLGGIHTASSSTPGTVQLMYVDPNSVYER